MEKVVPDQQAKAFQVALARRLGLSLDEVVSIAAEGVSGDERATIHVTASLPDAEVRAMFNEAGRS